MAELSVAACRLRVEPADITRSTRGDAAATTADTEATGRGT